MQHIEILMAALEYIEVHLCDEIRIVEKSHFL